MVIARSTRGAGVVALALVAVALGAGVVSWSREAGAQQRGTGAAYEYGELIIAGNDALLWTREQLLFIEGPETREPIRAVGGKGVSAVQPVRLIHLNALGPAGWEYVERGPGPSESYILRRRL
jgi:hypothetical protein